MDPALSLDALGRKVGGRKRVNHSHTHSQISWGDRTSGFNGLRTSGASGLHPRKGSREEDEGGCQEELSRVAASTTVSLVFAGTRVSGLLDNLEAGESR